MKISPRLLAASLLGITCSFSSAGFAQVPQPKTPPKAAPRAPLTKPVFAETSIKSPATSFVVKPPKPPLATAVAPKFPAAPLGQKGIIFVGGKPGDGKAALNPQPIPPGKVNPGDPIH
jgi:hypothetical protein